MSVLLRLGVGVLLIGGVLWLHGGIGDVVHELSHEGWLAVIAISANQIVSVVLCGIAWVIPLGTAPRRTIGIFIFARWIRDALNQLLPLMPLGGEVVGALVVSRRIALGSTIAALTVVDVTVELLSQVAFTVIGVGLWLFAHPTGALPSWIWIGLLLMLPMVGGFVLAQRLGLIRLLERLADRVMPDAWKAPDRSRSIHELLMEIYARRARIWSAVAVHLVAWFTSTVGVWLALRILGHPLSWGDVITLESVIFAVRAAAFLVPAALGVQEATYLLIGTALGLPPDVALALALIKRARELVLGLPAILAWQLDARRARRHSDS